MFRDDRTHPDRKMLCELLLQRIDQLLPTELVDSILLEQFGSPKQLKTKFAIEDTVETVLDKQIAKDLKEQWRMIVDESTTDKTGV
jgi:hypothetical protein